jgi:hypothetical protein
MDPTAGSADAAKVIKKFQDMCKAKGLKCTDIVLPGQPGAQIQIFYLKNQIILNIVTRGASRFTSS